MMNFPGKNQTDESVTVDVVMRAEISSKMATQQYGINFAKFFQILLKRPV
jgi:hypothetical protein